MDKKVVRKSIPRCYVTKPSAGGLRKVVKVTRKGRRVIRKSIRSKKLAQSVSRSCNMKIAKRRRMARRSRRRSMSPMRR